MQAAAAPAATFKALTLAWLVLSSLTLASLGLGRWFHGADWLPLLVAAILWFKGRLVARHFLECTHAHPFIAWLLRVFIAVVPALLLITACFGDRVARWATL